jgi:hypothetical protein
MYTNKPAELTVTMFTNILICIFMG